MDGYDSSSGDEHTVRILVIHWLTIHVVFRVEAASVLARASIKDHGGNTTRPLHFG